MAHLSPEPVAHVSQHRLLPMLLRRAEQRGAPGRVAFGHEAQAVQQTADRVDVAGATSSGTPWQLSCDYLVVADGARSKLR